MRFPLHRTQLRSPRARLTWSSPSTATSLASPVTHPVFILLFRFPFHSFPGPCTLHSPSLRRIVTNLSSPRAPPPRSVASSRRTCTDAIRAVQMCAIDAILWAIGPRRTPASYLCTDRPHPTSAEIGFLSRVDCPGYSQDDMHHISSQNSPTSSD